MRNLYVVSIVDAAAAAIALVGPHSVARRSRIRGQPGCISGAYRGGGGGVTGWEGDDRPSCSG